MTIKKWREYILPKRLIPKLPLILSPGSTSRVDKSQSQKTKQEKKTMPCLSVHTYTFKFYKIFVYVQNHLFMCKKKCEFGEDEITSSIVSTVCQYGHLASEKPAPPGIPDCDRSMWLSSHDPPPLEDPHVYPLTAPCFGLVRSNLIADL
jgi:hypothetical protein